MPSSAASAAMLRGVWAKLKVSSVMLIWKCLAMWRRPSTAPTAWPIAAAPRSGLRARCTRAAMRASSFSVTANNSARLRARSSASNGFLQTTRRSPG